MGKRIALPEPEPGHIYGIKANNPGCGEVYQVDVSTKGGVTWHTADVGAGAVSFSVNDGGTAFIFPGTRADFDEALERTHGTKAELVKQATAKTTPTRPTPGHIFALSGVNPDPSRVYEVDITGGNIRSVGKKKGPVEFSIGKTGNKFLFRGTAREFTEEVRRANAAHTDGVWLVDPLPKPKTEPPEEPATVRGLMEKILELGSPITASQTVPVLDAVREILCRYGHDKTLRMLRELVDPLAGMRSKPEPPPPRELKESEDKEAAPKIDLINKRLLSPTDMAKIRELEDMPPNVVYGLTEEEYAFIGLARKNGKTAFGVAIMKHALGIYDEDPPKPNTFNRYDLITSDCNEARRPQIRHTITRNIGAYTAADVFVQKARIIGKKGLVWVGPSGTAPDELLDTISHQTAMEQ